MASSSLTSTLTPRSYPSSQSQFQNSGPILLNQCLTPFPSKSKPKSISKSLFYQNWGTNHQICVKAQTLDFSGSFFEGGGGFGSEDEPPSPTGSGLTALEDKEEPQCPPGLRQYETMMVLRPDMSEDERLTLTQKYEELLVAGGGMYVEVFNRGVIPLAYSIKKKNKAGESNTYLDGIYLLFTYFTKPESISIIEETLQADDDVIRSMSFKIRKRKVV